MTNTVKGRLSRLVVTSTGLIVYYQPEREMKLEVNHIYKLRLTIDSGTEVKHDREVEG